VESARMKEVFDVTEKAIGETENAAIKYFLQGIQQTP
jgi:hypothetical protein